MTLLCEILFIVFAVSWIGLMGVFMYFMIRYREAVKLSMGIIDKYIEEAKSEPYPWGIGEVTEDDLII